MENKRKSMAYYLGALLGVVLLTGLDQVTKYFAVSRLKGQDSIVWIPGVFELSYLENRGAAFGIFENMQWLFILGTLVILAVAIYLFIRFPKAKRYLPFLITMTVIVSGAVGNLIDRLVNGYVVDFLYFSLIDFPVFNVADMYVTVGILIFIIFYLIYPDETFSFLGEGKK